ncbi:hypothetical protein ACFLUG_00420 [Chloroflexota bacterium]
MKKLSIVIVVAFLLVSFCIPHSAFAQGNYSVIQVSDSYSWVHQDPQVSGGQVVWCGPDENGNDSEIFLWKDGVITQVTNNDYADYDAKIDNGRVVWTGYVGGGDSEIFLWKDGVTTQITNNSYYDYSPQIDNGLIVWRGNNEIYLWDNGIVTNISHTSGNDHSPQIDNGQVVWINSNSGNTRADVYYWDGSSVMPITTGRNCEGPQINAGQIVWTDYDGNDREIFFWDGTTSKQITNDDYHDFYPKINNGQIVWHGNSYYAYGTEIFFWENGITHQLTNNLAYDRDPQIDDGQVVWWGSVGSDSEIFLWEGGNVQVVSKPDTRDDHSQIDEGYIVWRGNNSTVGTQVYLAIPVEANPTNLPPIAVAGSDQLLEQVNSDGTEVTLDGSNSSDPDEDPITFSWSADGIVFDDPTSATPSALFPAGITAVQLVVNDGTLDSEADTVLITVEDNVPPEVFPPDDISVISAESISLDIGTATATDAVGTVAIGSDMPDTYLPGVTTVTWTAYDAAGNCGTATQEITVQTPNDATQTVITEVENLYLPQGMENSIVSKLDNAVKSLEKSNIESAVNQLEAFINQVEAQRGKKLTDEQADDLIDKVRTIIDVISVSSGDGIVDPPPPGDGL